MEISEERKILYKKALKRWGETAQIHMMIEEMAELTKALMKFDRNLACTSEVAEEIADVKIMCEQMALIFCGEKVISDIENKKLYGLEKYIDNITEN